MWGSDSKHEVHTPCIPPPQLNKTSVTEYQVTVILCGYHFTIVISIRVLHMDLRDGLSSLGKTHTIVSHVKLSVIWADEYISQNPKGTSRGRDINTEESTKAFCLSQHRHL